MEVVICDIHDKICFLKTGTTPGTLQLGKSFYLCPHYPKECQFKRSANIQVPYCRIHVDQICDLQKIKFDYFKNKVLHYRCKKENATNSHWCGSEMLKSNEKNIPEVTKTDPNISNNVNLQSSVKAKTPLLTLPTTSEEKLRCKLIQQKKILQNVNVNKLPDKGQKLLKNIDEIESQLSWLKIKPRPEIQEVEPIDSEVGSEDETTVVSVTKQLIAAPKLKVLPMEEKTKTYSQAANKVMFLNELPPTTDFTRQLPSAHQFYGGRMSQSKIKAVKSATEEAIVSLLKSLQKCPQTEEEEPDPEGLRSTLKPHQRRALKWLLWREEQTPKGAILADDMGLGKTLTILSLILKDVEKGLPSVKSVEKGLKSVDDGMYQAETTLVICPAALISTWESEITHHWKFRYNENYLIYHGPNRENDIKKLVSYYVIITSYQIIVKEVGPGPNPKNSWHQPAENQIIGHISSPLMKIKWKRIVLDEGHTIKNPKTSTALAVSRLRSNSRVVVTGTPIHNNILDMYSLIRFLRYAPFDEYQVWKEWMAKSSSADRLNKLMKGILLRRDKNQKDANGNPIIELPKKTVQVHHLKLEGIERDVYEKILSYSKSAYVNFLSKKENSQTDPKNKINGAQLLSLLTRMQQCCTHLYLLRNLLDGSLSPDTSLDDDFADLLNNMEKLRLEENEPKFASNKQCSKISIDLSCYKGDKNFEIGAKSNKIGRILDEITKILNEKDDKCIVVSQWTSVLRIVGFHLKNDNIQFHVIEGEVNLDERSTIIKDLNNNPKGRRVVLLSLKAGGVGLNLVGANHLFLIDTHWNPALEQQACDRIYRIGQTKPVQIHKFVCSETIEESIMELQKRKLLLASKVLEGNADKNGQNFSLQDLKVLFEIS